jgi:hypothetical protein
MNKRSLQHNNLKNQGASWNDDPFDLPWQPQGVSKLSHEDNLNNYLYELVDMYAVFDGECYNVAFSKLSDCEQNELARLYLEYADRDTSECIYGNEFSINNDFVCSLLAMLKEDNIQSRVRFAETTRLNIIKHHQPDMQKLLDRKCDEYLLNNMEEAGFYARQIQDDCGIVWTKR